MTFYFTLMGFKLKNSFVLVLKSELSDLGAVFHFICFGDQTGKKKKSYAPNHCTNLFPLNERYPDSIIFVPACAEPAIN